ncbi:thiol reductant ABC exporter subunit CydC [Actinomadura scrupuli]|uniref:thiol reductant ABC exporter subunit CydC n=1 Tax=Actinomadura scrupuli TaxID=559629 RepID=UPI003D9927F6
MTRPLVRLVALARPGPRLLLGAAAGAAATGAGIALLATSAWLLARAAQHPSVVALSVAVVTVRTLGVGRGLLRYAERLVSHDAVLRALTGIRARVYDRLAQAEPLRLFRGGDLVTRLVSDVEAVQDLLLRGLVPAAVAAVAGGGTVVLVTALYWPAGGLLAVGLLLAGLCVPMLSGALGRRPGARLATARGGLATEVTDLLSGAPDLIAYGAMDTVLDRVAAADAELTAVARRDALLMGLGAGASALITGLTVWAVLLAGVAAVAHGSLTSVPLAVTVLTALAAFEVVAPLPPVAARLGALRAAAVRLFGVLDAPPAIARVAAPAEPPSGPTALRVRGLRVRYGPAEPWALDGVDLDLPPGRRIALVGPSGAGKSTLAAVLLRFRDPDGGEVLLGGLPLTAYDPDDARRVIGGVPQDPHVFAGDLRANLLLARPGARDAELVTALEAARLGPWLRELPDGLGTEAGAYGTRMSGGQRQRLALARALLADPPIMVLDEPTGRLDPEARRALTADLLDATRGRTTLLITHDLDGLEEVDEIVVLREGRVISRGSHADLLAAGGWYPRSLERTRPGLRPPSVLPPV